MCGIFGAISPGWDKNIIRTLAVCNRDRGTDSLGFFDSSGRMIKGASDPMEVLGQENITNWLERSNKGSEKHTPSWFIAGHTRNGTRGKANRKNAHPFRYGKIIGSHNGMVEAPLSYAVDSMVLFDELNKAKGDYQQAWGDLSGYWGLSWYDGNTFYLQVHTGELHLAQVNKVWYYSSEKEHLLASLGCHTDVYKFKEGETWKFTYTDGEIISEEGIKFESHAHKYHKTYNSTYDYYETNTYKASDSIKTVPETHDWDSAWRDAWDEYCTNSEHTVSV